MNASAYSSFTQWFSEGHLAPHVRALRSPGGALSLLDLALPAGDMSAPAVPDLLLHQDLVGGLRVRGNMGGGAFDAMSQKNSFFLAAPNFANTVLVDRTHRARSLSFPLAQWQQQLDEVARGGFSFERLQLYRGAFHSPVIQSAFLNLWSLCDEQGAPSRLLAQSAGCQILAELCRLGGAPFSPAKGGLAPWTARRCVELMRARLSEDISLDELAAEARLSVFHFARMFKQSLGVPPRVYLMQLRVERACELLETTDLPVTQIAHEVGYASNQVLARVFVKHRHMSPTDFRRAVRDSVGAIARSPDLRHIEPRALAASGSVTTSGLSRSGVLDRR